MGGKCDVIVKYANNLSGAAARTGERKEKKLNKKYIKKKGEGVGNNTQRTYTQDIENYRDEMIKRLRVIRKQ